MTQAEPATARLDQQATEVGSVFVSNYPPYSAWRADQVPAAETALDSAPRPDTRLGMYLHIPFCRRRCKFCYFRVYTDKNAQQIQGYLDALAREVERHAERACIGGRDLHYIYFGGGTPSYVAVKQLIPLVDRLKAALPWDKAEEIAFECEPGTLTRPKLEALREIGITRLSLGIENFDDKILEENGRAHLSHEIERVGPWVRELDFPQLNIDLIAGMVGESWETWRTTVQKAIDYDPDSVTIYQMELPFNTIYSKGKLRGDGGVEFADWATKREWHDYAIQQFEAAGYEPWSAYTMLKKGRNCRFVYTEALWQGADMLAAGVSSFGHMSGVHFQNVDKFDDYVTRVEAGDSPIARALVTTERERYVRELLLQFKRGSVSPAYFAEKFGHDIVAEFQQVWGRWRDQGLLEPSEVEELRLTRAGLLRVDQLLPDLYDEEHRGTRYT